MKTIKIISAVLLFAFGFSTKAQTVDSTQYDFKVSAILPFFSNLVEDTIGPPPRRELKMREISMDYVNGLRWASFRLAESGYNVELSLYDEEPDSLGTRLWDLEDIDSNDIVMGPLQQSMLSKSLRTIENSGAEHIILTKVNPQILLIGDHIRSILPSHSQFIDLILDRVLEEHKTDNVIFVLAGGADSELEQKFLEKYPVQPLPHHPLLIDTLRFDTIMGSRNSIGSLQEKIQFYDRNVIITLAGKRSRSMLSNLQSAVQRNDSTEIFVYANSDIIDLGFIDIPFLSRTRTTIPVSGIVDWTDSNTAKAVKTYRELYNTDPPKYAIRAHDAMLDAFSRKMADMPIDSTVVANDSLAKWDLSSLPAPIATNFIWDQVDDSGGWVNSTWELNTFYEGQWCPTDTVPGLPQFIEPQLDEEGYFIRPE